MNTIGRNRTQLLAAAIADLLESRHWGLISPESFRNVANDVFSPDDESLLYDKMSAHEAAQEAVDLAKLLDDALSAFEKDRARRLDDALSVLTKEE